MSGKIGTLWQVMRGHRLRYGLAIAAMSVGVGFMATRQLVIRTAIDHVISGEPLDAPDFVAAAIEYVGGQSVLARNLWIVSLSLLAMTLMTGCFMYLRGKWTAQASEATAKSLRGRLYDRLEHLPCSFHDKQKSGDLVQRCTSDVETIRMFLSVQVSEIARGVMMMAVILPIIFTIHVRMALIAMTVLPVIVAFAAVFYMKVKATFQLMDEAEGRMTAMLQENITGARVVRAFARQDFERARFDGAGLEYRDRWFQLMKAMAWYWPLAEFLCAAQRAIVVLAGAYFVITTKGQQVGEFTIGSLYAFITFTGMLLWPIQRMGRILADLGKALVSLGRVQMILSAQPESDPPAAADMILPETARGEIAFDHLSFSHGQDTEVLRDVSFDLKAGQTLAILGPSGSGKSTLINLLLRFYDYNSGSIRLDGVELKDLPRAYVRSQIGVVMQEPFLYSRTVRENIKFGRSSAVDDEMKEAAATARVHESIEEFDQGYETPVGERGVTLSGGQRQRVALARALLRNPPILILDDALSAVDMQTESVILRALRRRRGKHTTLVIAHRLATLMHADKIIALDEGRVVQSGTHASLLAEEGMYKRLWRMQTSLEDRIEAETP